MRQAAAIALCCLSAGLGLAWGARGFPGGSSTNNIRVPAFTLSAQSTWSAWVIVNAYDATGRRIIDMDAGGWLLTVANSGGDKFFFIAKWSTTQGVWTIPGPSAGAYHNIVVTYDGNSTANDPAIYVDGVSQTVTRSTGPAGTIDLSTTSNVIGNTDILNKCWNGTLAEIAYWPTILTAPQIAALAAGFSPLAVSSGTAPGFHWRLVGQSPEPNLYGAGSTSISGTGIVTQPRLFY